MERPMSALPEHDYLDVSVSGATIRILGIYLYPEGAIGHWRSHLALANEQLSGVSTGLGFFGDPGWVLGASLALGALEGALSSAKAQEGRRSLVAAEAAFKDLRSAGRIFELREVEGLDMATPAA